VPMSKEMTMADCENQCAVCRRMRHYPQANEKTGDGGICYGNQESKM